MAIHCDDNYIEMGCSDCFPSPPDKPLPFVFPAFNLFAIDTDIAFICHPSNPGQVGISTGSFVPSYTNTTLANKNFAQALLIVLDPPPGFPGPGLVQATATMTVSGNSITITMTNNGAGYSTGAVNHTFSNYFSIINVHYPTAANLCTPVGQLINALPIYPNISLASAKVIPQISGTIHFGEAASAYPFQVIGKWYKNGVQIGYSQRRAITSEGEKTFTHYGPPTTFTNTDLLDYQITCDETIMSNFSGEVLYYIQYI